MKKTLQTKTQAQARTRFIHVEHLNEYILLGLLLASNIFFEEIY